MAGSIRVRAKAQGEGAEFRILVNHPMETGNRKDEAGKLVPAHFIQRIAVSVNGKPAIEFLCGVGVSKDPYLGFRTRSGKRGDKVVVTWEDNLGQKDSAEVAVV